MRENDVLCKNVCICISFLILNWKICRYFLLMASMKVNITII